MCRKSILSLVRTAAIRASLGERIRAALLLLWKSLQHGGADAAGGAGPFSRGISAEAIGGQPYEALWLSGTHFPTCSRIVRVTLWEKMTQRDRRSWNSSRYSGRQPA